jgi:hypothetical protein
MPARMVLSLTGTNWRRCDSSAARTGACLSLDERSRIMGFCPGFQTALSPSKGAFVTNPISRKTKAHLRGNRTSFHTRVCLPTLLAEPGLARGPAAAGVRWARSDVPVCVHLLADSRRNAEMVAGTEGLRVFRSGGGDCPHRPNESTPFTCSAAMGNCRCGARSLMTGKINPGWTGWRLSSQRTDVGAREAPCLARSSCQRAVVGSLMFPQVLQQSAVRGASICR